MRCGNCKGNHEKVAEVRDCYAQTQEGEANAMAELEAERRNERWFEERGGSVEDDSRERDLQMMDDLRRETLAIQAKERAEDVAAYTAKMERDEEAMAASKLDQMTGTHGRDMASEKQVKYALDLLNSKVWPDVINRRDLENMERRQVSKLIGNLKEAPNKKVASTREDELAIGMYIADDGTTQRAVRVYLGQRSGHNLVKLLKGTADGGYEWEYVGSARTVASGRSSLGAVKLERMPLEEAKKWGKLTGFCCACGRRLDVPESVDAGIGPVCAGKDIWA